MTTFQLLDYFHLKNRNDVGEDFCRVYGYAHENSHPEEVISFIQGYPHKVKEVVPTSRAGWTIAHQLAFHGNVRVSRTIPESHRVTGDVMALDGTTVSDAMKMRNIP